MLMDPTTSATSEHLRPADADHSTPSANSAMHRTGERAALAGAMGLLSGLSACGGGDAGSEATASSTTDITPSSLASVVTSAAPANVTEAARFLAQATPGYTRADITALMGMSYATWINKQIALPRSQSHYDFLISKGYNNAAYSSGATGMDTTLWRKFISGTDALRQRVVLALSEICVVSRTGMNISWPQFAIANYVDILEANAFGNYRTLLEKISRSTAMATYLTFLDNTKTNTITGSQPDENYARELMQLFTIGLYQLNNDGTVKLTNGVPTETYVQADVSGLARVFTGWGPDLSGLANPGTPPDFHIRPLVQSAWRYESGSKTFLGTTVPAGATADESLKAALDTVFKHPNLPPFICRQLIQRLITSNPSAAYVGRVTAVFVNNGSGVRGDLAAVIKAILLDSEARNMVNVSSPTFGKLREPVLRFLNWARAFSVTSPTGAWDIGDLSDPGTQLGQSPLHSPSVFNFFRPGYVPPSTSLATKALHAPEFQITNEATVSGYVNFVQQFVAGQSIGETRPDYSKLMPLVADSAALLREVNLLLAANQVSATTLAPLKTALDTIAVTTTAGKTNRIQAAVMLILAAPEYIAQK